MVEIRTGYIETDGARLYYEEAGSGKPFVMLHAGIANLKMWDPQFEYFGNGEHGAYRVIRWDQRGFGKTVTTTDTFNRRDDLLAVLDALNVDAAIIMGCSMGGGVALDFTLEHPERVAALITIAGGISGTQPPADMLKAFEAQDAALSAGNIEGMIEMELRMWVDGPKRTPEQSAAAVRAGVRDMELENLKINTEGYKSAALKPPAQGRLGEIKVPTLVIVGDGDQPFTVEHARTIAQEVPGAEFFELPGVGHLPSMERADEVNERIGEFLIRTI